MGNIIVSRTYGTLQKARCSARQAFYFIKYTLIKTLKEIKMAEYILYIHLNVQICVQILCRILIFKGINGQFKIAATTQYITRIKDLTNKTKNCRGGTVYRNQNQLPGL